MIHVQKLLSARIIELKNRIKADVDRDARPGRHFLENPESDTYMYHMMLKDELAEMLQASDILQSVQSYSNGDRNRRSRK